jgi:dipeptidyl aminopeptidase/acylaminoacyl peptidase
MKSSAASFFLFVLAGITFPVLLVGCKSDQQVASISDAARIEQLVALDDHGIPVDLLFRNPQQSAFRISPDGRHISYLRPYKNRLNIYIRPFNQPDTVRLTTSIDRDISYYFWKNNSTLVYTKDSGGDENYMIFSVDTLGKEVELARFSNVRVNVLDELKSSPDEILISMNKNNPALFEPYRLNIRTGKLDLLATNNNIKSPVTSWLADNNGEIRVAVSVEEGTITHLLYRATEKDTFHTLLSGNWKDMVAPLFFDVDNRHIIALSNLQRDKTALVRIDPVNPDQPEVIFEHEQVDVWWAERTPIRQNLAAVYYVTDKKYSVYLDSIWAAVATDLERLLPGEELYFNAMDDAEEHFIIRTYSDVSPGDFYSYTRSTGKLDFLVNMNPELKAYDLAPMEAISYTARDGTPIQGYLTLPATGPVKNLPVVVMVHGGPLSRDLWGYKPDIQMLASRGYGVLQINYRGSWGYGKGFAQAGFKQWGQLMQDDISDGVDWLVNKGIANPKKIAIYGASYGGYAALAGLTFTPDLYACGISYVGPSNLFTLLENLPAYWEPEKEMMYEMIGHPVEDSALLHAISPAFHANQIKAPLFIAQGANDVRVTEIESEQMVQALRNRGVDVVYMLKENEGHGFRLEENRLEFYKAFCGFLEDNIPAASSRKKP